MSQANGNGARPVAVSAEGLSKHYLLGEHRSLRRSVGRVLHPRRPQDLEGLAALRSVDFTIHRGEAVGIAGSNGSGKSTLLQLLAGTTLPTGGIMRVHGLVLPLLAVGSGFHPELTGRENVTLFASSLGIPRHTIDERMDAVTDFGELHRHMDTPLKRWSSGMNPRLSFAIAVQFPADIYIFDEVLAVVDSEYQERCLAEIKRLHADGRTVIFVSHHAEQVIEVCERVIWIENGVVREDGPAQDILEMYAHAHGGHVPHGDGA